MVQGYSRPNQDYQTEEGYRVCFEGIFVASSLPTGQVILQTVEEILISPLG